MIAMKTRIFVFVCFLSVFCFSCSFLEDIFGQLPDDDPFTNAEAVEAMKAALNIGIVDSSSILSDAETGYFIRSKENGYSGDSILKIPLPPAGQKIQQIVEKVPAVGEVIGSALFDNVVEGINRSAEHAANEVVPIFSEAIKNMTIADGIRIVCGEKDAATTYLKANTYDDLVTAYSEPINKYLNKDLIGSVSANDAWGTVTSKYNGFLKGEILGLSGADAVTAAGYDASPVEEDLGKFATEKALDGLFYMIAQEEAEIRENPLGYASDIIKKVFGAVKAGFGK